MSSLAGALDDYRPSRSSITPLKREDYSSHHDTQDVDLSAHARTMMEQDWKPLKQEDSKIKVQGEDAEMDDLFGNDEDVEEAQPSAYVYPNDITSPSLCFSYHL